VTLAEYAEQAVFVHLSLQPTTPLTFGSIAVMFWAKSGVKVT